MDLEMEIPEPTPEAALLDRLSAAAAALESAADRLNTIELHASATREHDLQTRLAQAEQTIATLQAPTHANRKTHTGFVAKEAASLQAGSIEAGALDAALASLSLEQRIAVKAQLLRSGLLS